MAEIIIAISLLCQNPPVKTGFKTSSECNEKLVTCTIEEWSRPSNDQILRFCLNKYLK